MLHTRPSRPHRSFSRSSARAIPLAIAAALALTALAAYVAPRAEGQGGAPSPALNGTWQLAGSPEQALQVVAAAIEPAVAPLAPDIQRLARARIAETTWIPNQLVIQATPAQISVQFVGTDNRTFDTAPGQAQNVYSRSGVRAQMIQTYRPDGGIEQRFRALDGTQFNFLVPDPNGQTLNLDVLMQSQRLAQEIRFRVQFQRAR
jgi:hypothetical protein